MKYNIIFKDKDGNVIFECENSGPLTIERSLPEISHIISNKSFVLAKTKVARLSGCIEYAIYEEAN